MRISPWIGNFDRFRQSLMRVNNCFFECFYSLLFHTFIHSHYLKLVVNLMMKFHNFDSLFLICPVHPILIEDIICILQHFLFNKNSFLFVCKRDFSFKPLANYLFFFIMNNFNLFKMINVLFVISGKQVMLKLFSEIDSIISEFLKMYSWK